MERFGGGLRQQSELNGGENMMHKGWRQMALRLSMGKLGEESMQFELVPDNSWLKGERKQHHSSNAPSNLPPTDHLSFEASKNIHERHTEKASLSK